MKKKTEKSSDVFNLNVILFITGTAAFRLVFKDKITLYGKKVILPHF